MVLTSKRDTYAICIVFPVLGLVLIALRLWVRKTRNTPWKTDDYLFIPAWVCATGYFILFPAGIFDTLQDLKGISSPPYARIVVALTFLWTAANACIKLSIIFFYRRIFIGTGYIFSLLTSCLVFFVIIWAIYTMLSSILYCGKHISAVFNEQSAASCGNSFYYLNIMVFASDSFTDLCILVLPMPFLFKLNTRLRQKLTLTLVFVIGSLAVVGSLNTLVVFILVGTRTDGTIEGIRLGSPRAGPLVNILSTNWQGLELGFGLIAGNLPILKPIWGENLPDQFQRSVYAVRRMVPDRRSRPDPTPASPAWALQQRLRECVVPRSPARIYQRCRAPVLPRFGGEVNLDVDGVVGRFDGKLTRAWPMEEWTRSSE